MAGMKTWQWVLAMLALAGVVRGVMFAVDRIDPGVSPEAQAADAVMEDFALQHKWFTMRGGVASRLDCDHALAARDALNDGHLAEFDLEAADFLALDYVVSEVEVSCYANGIWSQVMWEVQMKKGETS